MGNLVINFHAVYDAQWMENIFLLLKQQYSIISLDEIKDFYYNGKILKNSCHITFDDGDQSFYEIVYPLLKKHRMPLSIYVSPEAAIKRKNFWFQEIQSYNKNLLQDILIDTVRLPSRFRTYPLHSLLKSLPVDVIWKIIEKYQEKTITPGKGCTNMSVY